MRIHLQTALVLVGGILAAPAVPVPADFSAGVALPSGVRPTGGALAQIDKDQTAVIWGCRRSSRGDGSARRRPGAIHFRPR